MLPIFRIHRRRVDLVSENAFGLRLADCLKYRRKMGSDFAARILQESIAGRKCSEQRLRHFAKICRVYKLVHVAYSSADSSEVS
jgi:hypothetical protein